MSGPQMYEKVQEPVEAIQVTRDNFETVKKWLGSIPLLSEIEPGAVTIITANSSIYAGPNYWLVRRVGGEVFTVRPERFAKVYKRVKP